MARVRALAVIHTGQTNPSLARAHTHVRTRKHTYTHARARTHTHIHTHPHTPTHTHIHPPTHTYTHTPTPPHSASAGSGTGGAPHAYIRAACRFLISVSEDAGGGGSQFKGGVAGDSGGLWYPDILQDECLSLADRTAFACRFLPPDQVGVWLSARA